MRNRSAANPDSKPLEGAERIRTAGSSPSTDPRPDDAERACLRIRGLIHDSDIGEFGPRDLTDLIATIEKIVDEVCSEIRVPGSSPSTEQARVVRAAYDECAGCGFMRQEHIVRGNGTVVVKTWDGDRADWRYVPCDGFREARS